MIEGVPVAMYLQVISALLGIVTFLIPLVMSIIVWVFFQRFSNRIDSVATDVDELLNRINDLEEKAKKKR